MPGNVHKKAHINKSSKQSCNAVGIKQQISFSDHLKIGENDKYWSQHMI